MRNAFFILVLALVLVVLASGCTSPAPAATPPSVSPAISPAATPATSSGSVPAASIPDLTGLWEGTADGYTTGDGFIHYPTTIFNISKQKGQIFIGQKEYPRGDGKTYYENLTGIITTAGDFYEADSIGGFSIGKLTGPDFLELMYLEEGADTKTIVMHLTWQKK